MAHGPDAIRNWAGPRRVDHQHSMAGSAVLAVPDVIRVAFLGRTSTYDQQDPTLSLPRQLRNCHGALPEDAVIVAHFYDIESGRKEASTRSQSRAHEMFQIPMPRDGGIQELLEEAARPDRRFDVVICEDISRVARRTYIATEIEHRLEQHGILLAAVDEGVRLQQDGRRVKSATQVLTRRVKQGVAEWYVTEMLEKSWDGFETHTEQGFNVGKPCYGYRADEIIHPVPAKRAKGLKKTKLRVDKVEGDVVRKMFDWRVTKKWGYQAIADHLNKDLVTNPPPCPVDPDRAVGMWTYSNVREVLTNPKHTGHMVWNRHARKGNGRNRPNPTEEWVWSKGQVHEQLVDLETFVQAQEVARYRERSRTASGISKAPQAKRVYRLRSYLHCAACQRRMCGNTTGGNGYYLCRPKKAWLPAGHPSVCRVREDTLLDVLDQFLSTSVFGAYREHVMVSTLRSLDENGRRERDDRLTALRRSIADTHTKIKNLLRTLEVAEDVDQDLMRDINQRRIELKAERGDLESRLAKVESERDQQSNPRLLDRLPSGRISLAEMPDELSRRLFEALRLEIHYSYENRMAKCRITLVGTTIDAVALAAQDAVATQFPSSNNVSINGTEESTMTIANALPTIDGLCSAPGAARTASTRNRTRRELLVSATVEIVRRRRPGSGAS